MTIDRTPALIPLPDHPYYLWQALTQCVNLPEHGVDPIFLVYGPELDHPRPSALLERLIAETDGVARWHFFPDFRDADDRDYNPGMKPALVSLYFTEYPEEVGRRHLYLDPDVLVMQVPDEGWDSLPRGAASDTDSYTGPAYLESKGVFDYLCGLAGVAPDYARTFPGSGAQYVIEDLGPGFWEEVYRRSSEAYLEMSNNSAAYWPTGNVYPVQAWCAEMYLTQLLSIREGRPFVPSSAMGFIWANDLAESWSAPGLTFYHNAGVTSENGVDFCKLTYQVAPWNDEGRLVESAEAVSPSSASWHYVQALREVTARYPFLTQDWRELHEHPYPARD